MAAESESPKRPRICVVTGTQLTMCPRMLKVARALDEEGYEVVFVHARFNCWADRMDGRIPVTWRVDAADCRRDAAFWTWLYTGVRWKIASWLTAAIGERRAPDWLLFRSASRLQTELVSKVAGARPDLIYGGSRLGLSVAAAAARVTGAPYALDLEDFHSAESEKERDADRVSEALETRILSGAVFLTAGSGPIAQAYRDKYGVAVHPIHNVVTLPEKDAPRPPSSRLKLYWFSQTIGPGRGLEDAIAAAGTAAIPLELHLRGFASSDYPRQLRELAASAAPQVALTIHEPAAPDSMVALAGEFDIGLCLEGHQPRNHDLALSNKALTYMAAGLALAMTDTAGHRELIGDLGDHALLFRPGDRAALAEKLVAWNSDRSRLIAARDASREAAARRWNWKHAEEQGAVLKFVDAALKATN